MKIYKTFGERLSEHTCLFCGAPLTDRDRCNYCGSQYIHYNEFKNLTNSPSILEIEAFTIEVSVSNDSYGVFCDNIQEVIITCSDGYYKILQDLLYYNLKNLGTIKKIDILLNYRIKGSTKEFKLFLNNSIIQSLQKKLKEGSCLIEVALVYDQFFISKE